MGETTSPTTAEDRYGTVEVGDDLAAVGDDDIARWAGLLADDARTVGDGEALAVMLMVVYDGSVENPDTGDAEVYGQLYTVRGDAEEDDELDVADEQDVIAVCSVPVADDAEDRVAAALGAVADRLRAAVGALDGVDADGEPLDLSAGCGVDHSLMFRVRPA